MSALTVLRAFSQTRWSRRFRSPDRLAAHQRRLLLRHLRFLGRHSPYFTALAAQQERPGDPLELQRLPLMDKAVMMATFDAMNTVGLRRDDVLALALESERSRDFTPTLHGVSVGLSSGTSGHRGLFVVSRRERERWAGTVLARFLPPGRILGQRIAFFLRADNTLYETVQSRVVSFRFFDVYDEAAENVRRLGAYRPTLLVAPPSVLLMLAAAVRAGELDIDPIRVVSVAEVLQPGDEAVIAAAFGQEVIHQAYQCTEGFLAHTCALGTLHLNEDLVAVEREELGDGRFIPIVTDLTRRAQPIVRYRLNDVLRSRSTPCPCGSALTALDGIEGREDDVLLLPGPDGQPIRVYSDLIVRAMMYAEGFEEFRVVQTGEEQLTVAVDALNAEVERSVALEMSILGRRLGFRPPALVFQQYSHDGSKKLRRVERAL
ncbi:CoF synthetase [Rathayibacter caricis DSM 15933]|uniref:CoF synthetase n=1 Tax=Rathayibacter caricis DSM 15933 TaxID=1328867 RepID=A0A2T4UPV1_9MICO|nr:F390 synthetase-related protein [Rathayibacter caricis]PTL71550.1 CoF synthetase [Rathayibacter caricis DSM 15933]